MHLNRAFINPGVAPISLAKTCPSTIDTQLESAGVAGVGHGSNANKAIKKGVPMNTRHNYFPL